MLLLAMAFFSALHAWLRPSPQGGALSVCLLDLDDGAPVEVCLRDALRALEAVAPQLGRVTVAAQPARSALLAALSRRQPGIAVATDLDGAMACLQEPVLVAGLGSGFRGSALAARARRLLSTSGRRTPKREEVRT